MIGIPLGLITANAVEWGMHKYVLHEAGRNKNSFWAFHFHEHHRVVRQHAFHDPNYRRIPLGWHAQGKEAWSLIAAAVAVAPLLPIAPFYVATLWYCAGNYYHLHKKAHDNPEWAREHLPWHYDHHLGRNADANWCVTKPWFDYVLGTREFMPDAPRESNVLGLQYLPGWLARRLPDPMKYGRVVGKREAKMEA